MAYMLCRSNLDKPSRLVPVPVDGTPCMLLPGIFVTAGRWLQLERGEWYGSRSGAQAMCDLQNKGD